jgi:hypothetical protein
MAIPPLSQRLDSILPAAPADAGPIQDAPLEPMPAEEMAPTEEEPTSELGTPSMGEDPTLMAGLGDKIISGIVRKAVTKRAPQAERALIPGLTDDVLGEAAKAGRFKLIPEASKEVAGQVEAAVSRRQKQGALVGKPSPRPGEDVPVEPFNLARYQTQDAAGVVAGVADALGIKTKAVTFDEIKAKAAESGISEAFLSRLIGNDGKMLPSAVETYKALEVLESSAKELDGLFKLVASGQASDVDKLRLRQQIAFHGLVQKGVKGMQTETARALAVFRIPRDGNAQVVRQVLDEYGGDNALSDMARSYLALESRAAQNQLIEKSMLSGIKDVWFSTYINGLLSSPVTHAKNIIGNATFGLYQIPERLIAAFYSNVLPNSVRSWRALVPGSEADKVAYDEALTMVQSLRNGITEGLTLASRAWQTGQPSDLMSKIEMQRGLDTPSISAAAFDISPDKWFGKAIDYYGTAVTLPGRALMSEDEFFKGVLYRMELNTQVTRRGKAVYREGVEAGMSETDAAAKALVEVEGLLANPPRDLDEAAMQFAQKGTFTSELPPALKSLQQVFNHPALKVIVPFFKTPANIGLAVVERTPFAPLSSVWREEIAKGGIYRDMALAKVTLGSGILATFGALATEGHITGRGPGRKADREALLRDGWQPYSLKIGDSYYSYAGLEPVSALLAIAADYAEYARHEPDAGKVEEVFLGATYGLYEYLKEQPYLQGIADVTKLIGTNQQGEVDGKKIVDGLAKQLGGFVIGGSPAGAYSSMVASIERLYDPTAKDVRASPDLPMGVRGFVEAFNRYRSRLPAFNEDLPPSLNLWGDPIQQGRGKAYEMVLPTRVSPGQFSVVDDALVRMGSPVGMPERKLQGVELDSWQYNRLLTIYGKEMPSKQAIADVMLQPGFALLTLDEQQKTVQSVHSKYMDAAKKQLISEDPLLQARLFELDELRRANGLYYKP